jgi:hypothetical protein
MLLLCSLPPWGICSRGGWLVFENISAKQKGVLF